MKNVVTNTKRNLFKELKKQSVHMIIAITGLKGSGKTTVAQYLQKKGFSYLAIPHFLSDEELPLNKISQEMNYVLEEITDVEQLESFKEKDDILLVRVDTPTEIRLERLTEKQKQENGKETSYEEVLSFERNLLEDEEIIKQQLIPVFKAAQVVIKNDADIDTLHKKVDHMLVDVSRRYVLKKPSDDSFYMEIAQVVAKRSLCIKRKAGALLVREKRVLVMDSDDTPRHIKHCNENGCPACNKEGIQLQCLCMHAEENVILQAAHHGISTKDAIVYTTDSPCLHCTQVLINAGIRELVFNEDAPLNEMTYALLREANVSLKPKKIH